MWYNITMRQYKKQEGFTLIEVLVSVAIFLIFALGVYSGLQIVFKVVYESRLLILETAILSEELEVARNLPYESVGIVNGVPAGLLPAEKSVTQNGINFNILTTVRNIDDPFDGTLEGSPADTSPADYKLVEISIICASCVQQNPTVLSTRVAPKQLEGATQNGALFIHVFDAYGQPVSGANLHIVDSATTPPTVIDDVTDTTGWLHIVDAPTGTLSYSITASKSGYSSDYTVVSSTPNPNPVKPPSNVVSQMITQISFSIDRAGSMGVHTINQSCSSLGGIPFSIHGDKVVGSEPDVYKYSQSFTTDGDGDKSLTSMEWDKYFFSVADSGYDLAGTVPMSPVSLNPGASQDVSLVLSAHTASSLLVNVVDAGTRLPLPSATVRLYKTGYDESLTSGLSYSRQTDWSSGSGQVDFTDETKYFSDSGAVEVGFSPGDVKLKKTGNRYLNAGWLESSTFNLGAGVNFLGLIWEPLSQPVQAGLNPIRFQLATSASQSPASWDYLGPDGTADTYYTATSTVIWSGHNGHSYLRYKLFLSTDDTRYTPQLSEFAITYTNGCTPPGQAFFSALSDDVYNLEISRSGYTTISDTIEVSGNTETVVNISPNP